MRRNFGVLVALGFVLRGAVAQLGERLNGIQEVIGSIPFSSTKSTIQLKTAAARPPFLFGYSNIPAMVAVRKFASVPASIARRPRRARSPRREGASEPMPPIWMAMDEKFAKPQRA